MQCMKCGKKIEETAVFCDGCLAHMERYPVKPGTPINLPARDLAEKKVPPKKLPSTPESRLTNALTAIKWLAGALVLALLALAVTVSMLVNTIRDRDAQSNIGQNYSAITTDDN